MSQCKLIFISLLTLSLLSCGILPIETAIKDNHFRFENFKRSLDDDLEYVYLMCSNKKLANWYMPQQYLGGEHDLWVTVRTARRNIDHSARVSFINFKGN